MRNKIIKLGTPLLAMLAIVSACQPVATVNNPENQTHTVFSNKESRTSIKGKAEFALTPVFPSPVVERSRNEEGTSGPSLSQREVRRDLTDNSSSPLDLTKEKERGFRGEFLTKATLSEVGQSATVSLIYPSDHP